MVVTDRRAGQAHAFRNPNGVLRGNAASGLAAAAVLRVLSDCD
jgi:hypothetical protein